MEENRFNILLNKYVARQLDAEGMNEFFELINTGKYDHLISDFILEELQAKRNSEVHIPVHVSDEIIRKIAQSDNFSKSSIQVSFKKKRLKFYLAAASFLAVIISTYFLFQYKNYKPDFASIIPTSDIVFKQNTTQSPIVYYLPDSSLITLHTGSSIHYAYNHSSNKREVFLEGIADFDVKKNKTMPFYVYCGTIVTKVLGTKFTVDGQNKTNINVAVKSGKVQVYENEKLLVGTNQKLLPVLLFPNQKVVYQEPIKQLNVTLVDTPSLIVQNNNYISESHVPVAFVYEKTKLADIVKQLELHYAIDIVLENEGLNNCVFTGDVTSHDLYTKLKIICLTINGGFQINGTKILITGEGCR